MKTKNSIIIGSGSWGKALAKVFGIAEIVSARGEGKAIDADYIFVATEAQKFREVISKYKIQTDSVIVICSKGIEQNSLKLLGEIVEEILPENTYIVLSGPNFADEIDKQLPAATTIACKDLKIAKQFVENFTQANLRIYTTDDVVATQIGGAVKNVIAIAAGIAIGKGLGENSRAAIITRGMAEIVRLAVAKGGKLETLMGLAGFGDMILTATSTKSRNTLFGLELARDNLKFGEKARNGIVEGYYTTKSVCELAQKLKIDMPICFSVYEILYKGKDINEAVNDLLKRPQG